MMMTQRKEPQDPQKHRLRDNLKEYPEEVKVLEGENSRQTPFNC